ncbi:hypothetical protein EHQ61_18590 [Leptospira wolffii]|uniref:hypothetical protein n=1 Tax=Leptospira wolffii TaxID=409998 RepID=UPI00108390DB|nr:hypothetical protein [Leptospira wolffii]TGL45278.1 hypothetical protein EHQ61_18590 [Leptospira wolffii]
MKSVRRSTFSDILFLLLFFCLMDCSYLTRTGSPAYPVLLNNTLSVQVMPGKIYFGGILENSNQGGSAFFNRSHEHYVAIQAAKMRLEEKLLHLGGKKDAQERDKEAIFKIAVSVYARPTYEYFTCSGGSFGDPMHPMYLPKISYGLSLCQINVFFHYLTLGIVPLETEGQIEVEYDISYRDKKFSYNYYPKYKAYQGIYPAFRRESRSATESDYLYLAIYDSLLEESLNYLLSDLINEKVILK